MIFFEKIKIQFFGIPSILMTVDVILKFLHISLWIDLSQAGLQDKIIWLGIIELCCLAIFLFPRTLTLGYFLLCCYWGGIIVVGLINYSFNLFPICMLALFTISAYWRDCSKTITLNSDNLK